MCVSMAPKAPPPVVIPPVPEAPAAPAAAPTATDPGVAQARTDERQRRLRAQAANNTLVTGGQGVTQPASTAVKTLYGQ